MCSLTYFQPVGFNEVGEGKYDYTRDWAHQVWDKCALNINLYLRMLSKSVETILSKFVETILSKYLSKNFVKICKKKSGREKNPFSIYR